MFFYTEIIMKEKEVYQIIMCKSWAIKVVVEF